MIDLNKLTGAAKEGVRSLYEAYRGRRVRCQRCGLSVNQDEFCDECGSGKAIIVDEGIAIPIRERPDTQGPTGW